MSEQHDALVRSLVRLLQRSSEARVFIVAGLHTGRTILSSFFKVAESQSLIPDDYGVREYNVLYGRDRPWTEMRGTEDAIERKQWLIIARLRWR
jgi:EEF1A N-terminal glycine/lysine methyltransferase